MNQESEQARPFIMHPNYVRAISKLPAEHQGEAYRVITEYGCFGKLPSDDTHWAIMAIFEAIQPGIDSAARNASKRVANNPYGRAGRPAVQPEQPTADDSNADLIEINRENNSTDSISIDQDNSIKSKKIENNSINSFNNSINNSFNSIKNENSIELIQEKKETETENEKESFPPHPHYKEKDKEKEIEKKEPRSRSDRACAREEFLKDYFSASRQKAIAKQARSLGISTERYRELVCQVLDDWEVNGPVPPPDDNMRMKMLNTARKKHAVLSRQGPPKFKIITTAVSPSSETRTREINAIYDRSDFLSGEALARKLAKYNLDAMAGPDQERQALADACAL